MKLPQTPPNYTALLNNIVDPARLRFIIQHSTIVDDKGRYLHWDQLRFKQAPRGLTMEEFWTGTRMARRAAAQSLPLMDSANRPFSYCEPPSLRASLRYLDMNAGGSLASDATTLSTGDGRLYLARSLAEEPFSSSLIEGAATTMQIAKKLIFEGQPPRTRDERMVLNNHRALEFVKVHRNDPLTLDLLLEIHRIVTVGTLDNDQDAGRIRQSNDVQVVDAITSDVLHQPPDFKELPHRLKQLISFANEDYGSALWVHPITRAILLHFMLAYEHPFVDGNGRVARALFYWSVLKDGYWLMEYVSISSIIAEAKIKYGRAYLYTETDLGDTTYFLLYNTFVLERAVTRLGEYVSRRRDELGNFERRLSDSHMFNHRQSWLLNEFARNRSSHTNILEHQERNGVGYLTARKDLESLLELSLLRKQKIGRTSSYLPVRDLVRRLTMASDGTG